MGKGNLTLVVRFSLFYTIKSTADFLTCNKVTPLFFKGFLEKQKQEALSQSSVPARHGPLVQGK